MMHVRFEGRSLDLDVQALGLPESCSDAELKRHLACHLDVRPERLEDYIVDHRPGGTVVVRPEAVYG